MAGETKRKRLEKLKLDKENRDIIDKNIIFNAQQNLAISKDISDRFGSYDTDDSVGGMYQRKSKKISAKADASGDFLKGVLNVTKAAVVGGIGMGIVGSIGAMARKKKKSTKPKRNKKK